MRRYTFVAGLVLQLVTLARSDPSSGTAQWRNSSISTAVATTTDVPSVSCFETCVIDASGGAFLWAPMFTHTVATLYITISPGNGSQHTSSSLQYNTTIPYNSPISTNGYDSMWLFTGLIGETSTVIGNGLTVVYPTDYVSYFGNGYQAQYLTTASDGSFVCTSVDGYLPPEFTTIYAFSEPPDVPVSDYSVLSIYGPYPYMQTPLPANWNSKFGLPPVCSLMQVGCQEVPMANQPVESLTVTVTLNQGGPPPPTLPSNIITSHNRLPSSYSQAAPSSTYFQISSPTGQPQTHQVSSQVTHPSPTSSSPSSANPHAPPEKSSNSPLANSPAGSITNAPGTPPPISPAALPIKIGSSTITLIPAGSDYVFGTESLIPGGPPITIEGTPISLLLSGLAAIVGGSTIPVPLSPAPHHSLIIGGSAITFTPTGSNYVFGTQTLKPGGPSITVAGTPVSLMPGGSVVVLSGTSIPFLPALNSIPTPMLTIGGSTFALTPTGSNYVFGTQTLIPDGPPMTLAGTPVSLVAGGSAVVLNGTTIPLVPTSRFNAFPTFTIGGSTITFTPAGSDYVIGTQTLTPGGPLITISGIPISMAPGGSVVVVGGITETWGPTSTAGIGALILSGFGTVGANSPTQTASARYTATPFAGGAGRAKVGGESRFEGLLGLGLLGVWVLRLLV